MNGPKRQTDGSRARREKREAIILAERVCLDLGHLLVDATGEAHEQAEQALHHARIAVRLMKDPEANAADVDAELTRDDASRDRHVANVQRIYAAPTEDDSALVTTIPNGTDPVGTLANAFGAVNRILRDVDFPRRDS